MNDKNYYSLKDLIPITNLQYRQLKYRVKKVNEKYKDNDNDLIFKSSNRWFIHKSIVKDFKRKREKIDYKLFITINPEGNYPPSMLKSFVKYIHTKLKVNYPLERIKYVIEHDKRNYLHIHILTSFNFQRKIRDIMKTHILSQTLLNIKIKKVLNSSEIKDRTDYMSKENKPILIRH